MFQFRNMQTFIRNCIEPHVVAISTTSKSRFTDLLARLSKMDKEHLELLLKLDKDLREEMKKLMIEVDTKVESVTTVCVGWIGFFPTNNPPEDINKWFYCDGAEFNTTTYRKLYQVLKSPYLPDYRGLFLRMEGGNAAALGIKQSDRMRNIVGEFGGHAIGWMGGFGTGPFTSRNSGDRGSAGHGSGTRWGFDASRTVPTGPESNPVNKSVKYYIRALD